ncbi:MAG: site-2 protease family protein [Clostridia bacterium]|nr:site-2 protease family protein [Clostridia bacterium]
MFNFTFDKRIVYAIIAVMAFRTIYEYATVEGALLGLILTIPGVLIAITFHEFAHAFVADKLGDDTPRREGRLSLNPIDHLDPVGSLLLLFAGFGWGKPVQVNPRNYTRKMSMEKGEAIVSIAGPLMNFILAIIFTIITCIVLNTTGSKLIFFGNSMGLMASSDTIEIVLKILLYTVSINVGLGIFNLIPLPPLDGSKVIMPFLPYKAKQFFVQNEMIFYIAFVVIWVTGITSYIISPIISAVDAGILKLGLSIFGI